MTLRLRRVAEWVADKLFCALRLISPVLFCWKSSTSFVKSDDIPVCGWCHERVFLSALERDVRNAEFLCSQRSDGFWATGSSWSGAWKVVPMRALNESSNVSTIFGHTSYESDRWTVDGRCCSAVCLMKNCCWKRGRWPLRCARFPQFLSDRLSFLGNRGISMPLSWTVFGASSLPRNPEDISFSFIPAKRPTYIARACILSLMCLDGGNSVRQVVFHSCHNCFPLEYAKCTLHGVNHWRLREKETERQWVLEKWICPWLVITKPVTSDTEKKLSRDPLHDCLLRFEAHL